MIKKQGKTPTDEIQWIILSLSMQRARFKKSGEYYREFWTVKLSRFLIAKIKKNLYFKDEMDLSIFELMHYFSKKTENATVTPIHPNCYFQCATHFIRFGLE